jgi:hypothetical protein
LSYSDIGQAEDVQRIPIVIAATNPKGEYKDCRDFPPEPMDLNVPDVSASAGEQKRKSKDPPGISSSVQQKTLLLCYTHTSTMTLN